MGELTPAPLLLIYCRSAGRNKQKDQVSDEPLRPKSHGRWHKPRDLKVNGTPMRWKGQNIKLRTGPFSPPDSSLAVMGYGQTALQPVLHIYRGYALVPWSQILHFHLLSDLFYFFPFLGSDAADA